MPLAPGAIKAGAAFVSLCLRSSGSQSDRDLGNLVLAGLILNAVVGSQPLPKDLQS